MKKVLWLIVCLMTMVAFTSCSRGEEDEITLDSNTIIGSWYDQNHNMSYFFYNGKVEIFNDASSQRYDFLLTDTQIILTKVENNDGVNESLKKYYESKIKEAQEELKTARGDRAPELISIISEYRKILDGYKKTTTHYYGKIVSKSLNEFIFTIDDELYKLHRTSKHSNF